MRTLVALAGLVLTTSALAVPTEVSHQGTLVDSTGQALTGSHDVTFVIYDGPSGGTELWSETLSLELEDGFYAAVLGRTTDLDSGVFDGSTRYLGLAVDGGTELGQRAAIVSVPYAIRAGSLSGGPVDATELSVNGTLVVNGDGQLVASSSAQGTLGGLSCSDGDAPVYNGNDWTCAPNETPHTTDASALITGTLDIARLPVGTGDGEVAAGGHTHGLAELSGTLSASQLPSDFADSVVAAAGAKDPANPLNHDRYSDSEAVAAMGATDSANPLNHDAYTDEEAVAAVTDGLFHTLNGQFIKLYGVEITLSNNNPQQTNPHLNITATRGNHIGSSLFELVGAKHCGYCYSAGPKAVIYSNGNVPFTYYTSGDNVYVEMDTTNTIVIRSSYPIAPEVVDELPSNVVQVLKMN